MDKQWKCPNCSQMIEGSFDVCWHCGANREGVIDTDFDPVPSQDVTDDADDLKEDFSDEPTERKRYHPIRRFFQSARTPYALAWFFALLTAFSMIVPIMLRTQYNSSYLHYTMLFYSISMMFLIACISFIAHRKWSYRWLQISLVWVLALGWPGRPQSAPVRASATEWRWASRLRSG